MISPSEAHMLDKIRQNIQSHKLAKQIIEPHGKSIGIYQLFDHIGRDEGISPIASHHEFHINWEWEMLLKHSGDPNPPELLQVACKSLLDGLTLDVKNKKAIIYDLKTTQKLWHFEESIEMYDYCRQLMYYTMAVRWYLKNERYEDPKEWEFKYYIIGIDTTGSYEIRVFEIDEAAVLVREFTIADALMEIAWHQSTGNWDHSREYYEGDGSESLNL